MSPYARSQSAILEAERATRDGNLYQARKLYFEAATLQRDAVMKLPASKPITKSVFVESAAVLFERAGDHEQAAATRRLLT